MQLKARSAAAVRPDYAAFLQGLHGVRSLQGMPTLLYEAERRRFIAEI